MLPLVATLLLLIASHIVPSAPGIRGRAMASFGRSGFYAGYGLISTLSLIGVIWAFQAAPPGPFLYAPAPAARALTVFTMPVAILLLVARFTTKPGDRATGIYRITTVPGSAALLLWCGLHLLNLGGDARLVVIFAAMAAIAAIAAAKNAALARRRWPGSRAIPFLAILHGRDRLVWAEIGWRRIGLAAAVYLAILALHPIVIGVDPLAGLF